MQTFLPYASFEESAKCLDNKRLGNQRNEAVTILNTLYGKLSKWKNHPAVKMWVGYELSLSQYLRTIILEWERRGNKNSIQIPSEQEAPMPWWFGTEEFHASHRSNLLRKSEHYAQFNWKEPPDLPYFWPKKEKE